MRLLGAVALIALATTGCIGSDSSARSGSSSAQGPAPSTEPRTDVMITYAVPIDQISTCPDVTRCTLTHGGDPVMLIGRRLTCSPDAGDYDDRAAACRALSDVVAKFDKMAAVCFCASQPEGYIPAKAVGYYNGKRRTIPLDACSLCGLQGVGADLAVLLPGAEG